ncbi:hypothetical protein THASP1DRAFT_27053, partial [Thamnocephalis sphaerospora]
MQTVRQKWQLYRTYQRLQRCWEEYLLVSGQDGDAVVVRERLCEFLDTFSTAHADWMQAGVSAGVGAPLDKFYGDCSEVVVNLLFTVESEVNRDADKSQKADADASSVVIKALNVVNIILKEEKYRHVVANTPNLINRILALLGKARSAEVKRRRHKGFKMVIQLLQMDDTELTAEVMRTIQQLAEVSGEVPAQFLLNDGGGDEMSLRPGEQPLNAAALFGGTVGGKVTSIVSDVRELMSAEFGRVFPQLGSNSLSSDGRAAFGGSPTGEPVKCEFILSSQDVEAWLERLSIYNAIEHGSIATMCSQDERKSHVQDLVVAQGVTLIDRWRNLVGFGKDKPTEQAHRPDTCSSRSSSSGQTREETGAVPDGPSRHADTIKGFMRTQGVLRALTRALAKGVSSPSNEHSDTPAAIAIDTICKLIYQNSANQRELRELDGYEAMRKAFDQVVQSENSADEHVLQDFFNMFFTIALDGSPSMMVGNSDAYIFLFRMAASSAHAVIRRHAVLCIKDLVSLNPFNAIIAWKYGGVDMLLEMLNRATKVCGDESALMGELGLNEDATQNHTEGSNTIMERLCTTALEQAVDASMVYQYIASVTWLLEYISEYTRILMQITLPSWNVVVGIMLRSVGRILTDLVCRQCTVEPKFLNIYLQLLRRAYHMQDSAVDMDENLGAVELLEHNVFLDSAHPDGRYRAMAQEQHLDRAFAVTGRDMDILRVNQGFQILHDSVALSTTLCWVTALEESEEKTSSEIIFHYDTEYERLVSDMSMWILRECLLCQDATRDGIKWLIKLLKHVLTSITALKQNPSSIVASSEGTAVIRPFRFGYDWFHAKICQLFSSVFRRSDLAKKHFGELGGIEVLLAVLSQTRDIDVATYALIAVGDLFAGGEETKQLVGETFGYEGFMELVLSSHRPLDRLCCQIILEVATVGNVVRDLSEMDIDEEPFSLSSAVVPFISSLLAPAVLFDAPLPLCFWRRTGLRRTTLGDRTRIMAYSRAYNARHSAFKSRPSSVFSDGNRRYKDSASSIGDIHRGHDAASMLSMRPRSISGALADPRTEILLEEISAGLGGEIPSPCLSPRPESGAGSRKPSLRQRSSIGASNCAISDVSADMVLAKRLIGVVFRDKHAATMALKLLFRVADGGSELRTYYFDLFVQLLQVNTRNQQLVCLDRGLEYVVRAAIRETLEPQASQAPLPPASFAGLISLIGGYDVSPEDAALLLNAVYDPARIGGCKLDAPSSTLASTAHGGYTGATSVAASDLRKELLIALMEISSRLDPTHTFSFDGAGGILSFPLERLPGPRYGYTVSLWVKITAFLGESTGLLCYEDQYGSSSLFELYFRMLPQSGCYCLCVRTQNHPLPPEDFVFYGFDFAASPGWHHVALVHSRQYMTLFVNGTLVQTCNTFSYPRISGRDRAFVGVFGRRGQRNTAGAAGSGAATVGNSSVAFPAAANRATHAGTVPAENSFADAHDSGSDVNYMDGEYFCGQISSVYFLEGAWDRQTAEKVFNEGPHRHEDFRALGVDHRKAIRLSASASCDTSAHLPITSLQPTTAFDVAAAPASAGSTGIWRLTADTTELLWSPVTMSRGCTAHRMRKLRDVIGQVGGPQVCFSLMEAGLEQQLFGLHIIASLLHKSPENRTKFIEVGGFDVVRHLLRESRWELVVDHFSMLLDIACDGHMVGAQRVLVDWESVGMCTDLVIYASEHVQLQVVRTLADELLDVRENLVRWRSGPGLALIFDLLQSLPSTLHQFLLRLVDAAMDDLTVEEIHYILDFIAFEKRQYLDLKCELLELLLRHATWCPLFVERLSAVGGLNVLLTFLDLPSERFRITILKLMGVLMGSNARQSRALMAKIGGFDAMWLFMAPFPVSADM